MANGCTGSVLLFCEVWQQDLLAQQAGAHAFLLGAFTKMHADETGRSDATNIAATNTSDAVTLLTISCFLSMTKTKGRAPPLNLRPLKQETHSVRQESGRTSLITGSKMEGSRGNMINTQYMVDPVCKMQLRTEQVRESILIDGETYYFCSIGCRAEFQRHPEDYLRRLSKEDGFRHV